MLPARCRLVLSVLVVGCFSSACSGAGDDSSGRLLQSIEGGQSDTEHLSVFGTVSLKNGEASTCTATLIAPNLLVTARHCIASVPSPEVICGQAAFGEPIPVSDYLATNSRVIETSRTWFRASRIDVPSEGNDTCGFDIALVTLSENVPSSVAKPTVPRIDRGVTSGEEYTAVGYGIDVRGNSNGRSVLTGLEVACDPGSCGQGVRVSEFRGTAGVCEGDSGGPALDAQGKVVGVVSRGGEKCTGPVYGSISAWSSLIQRVALAAAEAGDYEPPFWALSGKSDPETTPTPAPTPIPSPTPTPAPTTPVPPDLGGQGAACSGGNQCLDGFGCYRPNAGDAAYCVEKCSTSADCGSGLSCVAVGSGSGEASVCLERRAPGPIPTGEPEPAGEDDASDETSTASCSMGGPTTPSRAAEGLAVLGVLALVRRRRRFLSAVSNHASARTKRVLLGARGR